MHIKSRFHKIVLVLTGVSLALGGIFFTPPGQSMLATLYKITLTSGATEANPETIIGSERQDGWSERFHIYQVSDTRWKMGFPTPGNTSETSYIYFSQEEITRMLREEKIEKILDEDGKEKQEGEEEEEGDKYLFYIRVFPVAGDPKAMFSEIDGKTYGITANTSNASIDPYITDFNNAVGEGNIYSQGVNGGEATGNISNSKKNICGSALKECQNGGVYRKISSMHEGLSAQDGKFKWMCVNRISTGITPPEGLSQLSCNNILGAETQVPSFLPNAYEVPLGYFCYTYCFADSNLNQSLYAEIESYTQAVERANSNPPKRVSKQYVNGISCDSPGGDSISCAYRPKIPEIIGIGDGTNAYNLYRNNEFITNAQNEQFRVFPFDAKTLDEALSLFYYTPDGDVVEFTDGESHYQKIRTYTDPSLENQNTQSPLILSSLNIGEESYAQCGLKTKTCLKGSPTVVSYDSQRDYSQWECVYQHPNITSYRVSCELPGNRRILDCGSASIGGLEVKYKCSGGEAKNKRVFYDRERGSARYIWDCVSESGVTKECKGATVGSMQSCGTLEVRKCKNIRITNASTPTTLHFTPTNEIDLSNGNIQWSCKSEEYPEWEADCIEREPVCSRITSHMCQSGFTVNNIDLDSGTWSCQSQQDSKFSIDCNTIRGNASSGGNSTGGRIISEVIDDIYQDLFSKGEGEDEAGKTYWEEEFEKKGITDPAEMEAMIREGADSYCADNPNDEACQHYNSLDD